jgi:protein-arginine deiminase
MQRLLAESDNYRTILQPAIVATSVNYYYDEGEMPLADVAAHCRWSIDDDTPMSETELLDYKGKSSQTNDDYLRSRGNIYKGWIKIPGFWKVDDLRPDALNALAQSLEDPPWTLQELFEEKERGLTNAERLLRPGRRMVLPKKDDRWMQDCMEIGYSSLPKHKIDAVMRAPRNRPLRSIAPGLLGEDFGYHAPGTPRQSNTFDANGNLEVTPPCTLETGKKYPWGRIYYGPGRKRQTFDPDVETFLKKQVVQEPIVVDSGWLQVGHVDEMISWVPAPTNTLRAEFPYRLLVTSPARAMKILEDNRNKGGQRGMLWRYKKVPPDIGDAGEALELSERRKVGCASIDAFLTTGMGSDRDFQGWQNDVQSKIDDVVKKLKTQTGVKDDEIIKVPILYEKNGEGNYEAVTAAMVNMLVINNHCIIPKPYGPIVGDADLFQKELEDKLNELGLTTHWIDDWYEYHVCAGEVHCGTNTLRKPAVPNWWEFVP